MDYEDHGCTVRLRGSVERVLHSSKDKAWSNFSFKDLVLAADGSVTMEQTGVRFALAISPQNLALTHGDQALHFSKDFLGVFEPGSFISGSWGEAFRIVTLQIAPETVERISDVPIGRLGLRTQFIADDAEKTTRHLLLALAADLEADCPTESLLAESVATCLLRTFSDAQRPARRRSPVLTSHQAAALRDFIVAHASERMSLQQLADVAGLSIGHLVRAFKGTFGVTPYQYLLRERVNRAHELIEIGERSLSEIAKEVGFADPSQMSKTFRRVMGRTPSEARRLRRR